MTQATRTPAGQTPQTKSELAKRQQSIFQIIESKKADMAQCLPKHLTGERWTRLCLTCLRKVDKLQKCGETPEGTKSLLSAMFELAALGLEPNSPLQHAFILPYENRRGGVTEAQVIIGYMGYIALAYRSEIILNAEVVYEGDEFLYDPSCFPQIKYHKPCVDEAKRGEIQYAYMSALLPDGRVAQKVITKAEILRARSSSAGYRHAEKYGRDDTPWISDFDSMARKTAIRRGAKFLPMCTDFARALELDETEDLPNRSNQTAQVIDVDSASIAADVEAVTKPASSPSSSPEEPPEPVSAGTLAGPVVSGEAPADDDPAVMLARAKDELRAAVDAMSGLQKGQLAKLLRAKGPASLYDEINTALTLDRCAIIGQKIAEARGV